MKSDIPLLQNVRVASPCSANWAAMTPVDGDRVRHCESCNLNVYNLSAMGQAEAEGLLRKHEGRLCVRYIRRRRDGMIMTRDCPVGASAVKLMLVRRSLFAALLVACGLLVVEARQHKSEVLGGRVPIQHAPRQGVAQEAAAPVPVEETVSGTTASYLASKYDTGLGGWGSDPGWKSEADRARDEKLVGPGSPHADDSTLSAGQ
jgi:hypothetical protein